MQRGFIHMWRKLADNPIAKNPYRLSVFIHVLLRAAWKDTTVVMNVGRGTVVVPLKRGQLLIGRNTLSELTGIPPSTVRNHLQGLNKKTDRELDIKSDKHWSIITVINYDTYNPLSSIEGQASGQASGHPCGQASDRHRTGFGHKEEVKDLKDFEEEGLDQGQNPIGAKKPRRSRAPFVPPTVAQVAAYCDERNNDIDPEYFVNSNTTKGWMVGKSPMVDWKAAIRTWEGNGYESGRKKRAGPSATEPKGFDAVRARAESRRREQGNGETGDIRQIVGAVISDVPEPGDVGDDAAGMGGAAF